MVKGKNIKKLKITYSPYLDADALKTTVVVPSPHDGAGGTSTGGEDIINSTSTTTSLSHLYLLRRTNMSLYSDKKTEIVCLYFVLLDTP